MKVKELIGKTGWTVHSTEQGLENEVIGAFVGDLLSWVIGNAQPSEALITVQAHLNVVAVAVLRELSCIIVCHGATVLEETIAQATEENLPIIECSLSAYEVSRALIQLGL